MEPTLLAKATYSSSDLCPTHKPGDNVFERRRKTSLETLCIHLFWSFDGTAGDDESRSFNAVLRHLTTRFYLSSHAEKETKAHPLFKSLLVMTSPRRLRTRCTIHHVLA